MKIVAVSYLLSVSVYRISWSQANFPNTGSHFHTGFTITIFHFQSSFSQPTPWGPLMVHVFRPFLPPYQNDGLKVPEDWGGEH